MNDTEGGDEPSEAGALSRRGFLGLTGAAAAAAGLASTGVVAGFPTAAGAAIANRTYYASLVGLEIDGTPVGMVETAEGGEPFFSQVANSAAQVSLAGPSIEPLTLVYGGMTRAAYDWIVQSTQGKSIPARNVAVLCYDLEYREWYRLMVDGARITGVELSALDAAASGRARFKVTITGGQARHRFQTMTASVPKTFKIPEIFQANFRFTIGGNKDVANGIRALEPVSLHISTDGAVSLSPLKLEVNTAVAGFFYSWMAQALAGKFQETTGELLLLDPTMKTALASLNFTGLGILRVSAPVKSASSTLSLVSVELYSRNLAFNLAGLG